LALFCSVKCPGNLILQTYDLTQNLRQTGVSVISGFHSPMERECLSILLRGTQPIIVCPARSIVGMRIQVEYKQPLEEGRLLLLSPFAEKQRRATVQTALYRNQFVAALADAVFVTYAAPGGKTEQFCRDVLAWQKPLYILESDANANLIALGAKPVTPDTITEWM
jgi:predicted Rossmann fold nucleotide-binding protein DprA/Smf involved in DNA uptake